MSTENDHLRITIRTNATGEGKDTLAEVNIAANQRVRIRPDGSESYCPTDARELGVGDQVKIISKVTRDGETNFAETEGVVMEIVTGGKELLGEQLVPSLRVEDAEAAAEAADGAMFSPTVPASVSAETPVVAEQFPETKLDVQPRAAAEAEVPKAPLPNLPGAMQAMEMVAAMLVQDKRFVDAMMTLMLNDDRYVDGLRQRIHQREHYMQHLNKVYQNSLYMASGAELSTVESDVNNTLMGMRNPEEHPTAPGKPVFFHLADVQDHGPRGEHIVVKKWVELDQPGTLPPAVHAAFQADDVVSGKKYFIALVTPPVEKQRELLELAKEEVSNERANDEPDGDGASDAS